MKDMSASSEALKGPQPALSPKSHLQLILLITVIALVFGIGGFLLGQSFSKTKLSQPAATASPIPTKAVSLSDYPTFQNLLDDICGNLTLDNLPVDLDQEVLKLVPEGGIYKKNHIRFSCSSGWSDDLNKSGQYLRINLADDDTRYIYVHDDKFYDEGHGGSSHFLPIGELIGEIDGVEYRVFVPSSEAGRSADSAPIRYRARKVIRYIANKKVNEKVYVTMDKTAIAGGDPRLVQLLKQYPTYECGMGSQERNCISGASDEELNQAAKNRFFLKFPPSAAVEREALQTLSEMMGAVSSRYMSSH